ncbi:MAG: glycoside hydrolase family 15 protein [Myxococcota bacterium]
MDLFTASDRLSRTFEVDGAPPALGMHGVIGDGFTCALVGVDGSVDWLCMPRFDSPSVFASILDPERGGSLRVSPATRPFSSLQAYDSNTNVLQTLFRRPGEGSVVVTDFMPWSDDPRSSIHEIHRLIESRDGALPMEVVFDPRLDYARGPTRVVITEHGAMAEGPGGDRLCLSLSGGGRFETRERGGVVARFTARPGKRQWVILSWRAPQPEASAAYRPFEHLRRTRRFWRSWSGRLRYDGPWRHDVLRSALTLKLLQYSPTGAIVAAATTSLPAWPGGDRNWDYRYAWARDSAFAIRAMNLIGYMDEARGFFHFVRDTIESRGRLDLMVSVDGADVPEEVILSHLAGYQGSGPVRVGNGARDQLQLDIIGALLDAAWLYERSGAHLSLRLWRQLRELVYEAMQQVDQRDHGIWEPRADPAHHVHSKLMTWVALDRVLRLAPLFGDEPVARTWSRARKELREEILRQGYNESCGTFVDVYGGTEVDATLLLFPLYGFLPASDPRVERTRKRVMQELRDGRFLRRYRSHDGIQSEEGGFVLCGFWLAEALALAGRIDEALEVFHDHTRGANHLGLLAEEVMPETGAPLGNFPQAFSHLGLINAAARIDLALRLRDEGAEHSPRHAIDLPHRI